MANAEPYNKEFFKVTFPAEYVAHVEINRPEKLNAFKEVYVLPSFIHLTSRDMLLHLSITSILSRDGSTRAKFSYSIIDDNLIYLYIYARNMQEHPN
jgi:hypothetical protein